MHTEHGEDRRGRLHDGHAHHDPSAEHDHAGDDVPEYDRGLDYDLGKLGRRRMLGLLAGAGLIPVVGPFGGTDLAAAATSAALQCVETPEETDGPYPADGSNGPNVLDDTGIVRRNVRRSFDGATGYAEGVALTIKLRLLDSDRDCRPRSGAAIYIWQCDREAKYSMYSPGVEDENYLRGVQRTDREGWLEFRSVFPGCYAGRWPHIHFEVYPSIADATIYTNKIATSQLAFPGRVCRKVYGTEGYEQSLVNLRGVSLETDGVFRDGWETQLATVRGNVRDGITATLSIAL